MSAIAVARHQFFEQQQICSYIPTVKRHCKMGKQVAHESSFKYDLKQDLYTCQAGHALYPNHVVGATKYHHIKKAHCNSCPWQSSCYLGMRNTYLYRNEYKAAIERVRQQQGEEAFQQRMKERRAEEQHGLRRAKYRGLEKMQMQAYGIGITQNLKRLAVSLDFYFCWFRFQFIQRFLLLRYSFQG